MMSAVLLLLIVAVAGSAGMVAVLGWFLQRINRLEQHGPGALQRLAAENEELQEQMRLLEVHVERLSERVDFTEKLLERPRGRGANRRGSAGGEDHENASGGDPEDD